MCVYLKNMVNHAINMNKFELTEHPTDPKHTAIQICDGEYAGTVFSFGKINFPSDEELARSETDENFNPTVNFSYEIHTVSDKLNKEDIEKDSNFINEMIIILESLLTE